MTISTKRKAIVLDIDGVVLDWFSGFRVWMRIQGHKVVGGLAASWNMTDTFPELSSVDINIQIDEFNKSNDFGRLRDIDDARFGVDALRYAFPDWPVVAVTSSGTHPRTVAHRCWNVMHYDLSEIYSLPLGAAKTETLRRWAPGSIIVEDNLKHCEDAVINVAYRGILLDRPYNQGGSEPGMRRIKGWHEIGLAINDIKGLLEAS
jgi:hypothetical protein